MLKGYVQYNVIRKISCLVILGNALHPTNTKKEHTHPPNKKNHYPLSHPTKIPRLKDQLPCKYRCLPSGTSGRHGVKKTVEKGGGTRFRKDCHHDEAKQSPHPSPTPPNRLFALVNALALCPWG